MSSKHSVIVVCGAGVVLTAGEIEILKKHFGLELVVERWVDNQFMPMFNTLVLTMNEPRRVPHREVVRADAVLTAEAA